MAKYVDNQTFNQQLIEYLKVCKEKEEIGEEIPQIPREIGESFIKIANGLSESYRFSRYPYRQELVGNAILACTTKIRNYDYVKFSNPFAYFTQICWFEFLGTISAEEKEDKILYKMCEQLSLEDFNLDADDVDSKNQYLEFLRDKIEQRELEKIRDTTDNNKKKFVHRMITQKKKVEDPVASEESENTLPFD